MLDQRNTQTSICNSTITEFHTEPRAEIDRDRGFQSAGALLHFPSLTNDLWEKMKVTNHPVSSRDLMANVCHCSCLF